MFDCFFVKFAGKLEIKLPFECNFNINLFRYLVRQDHFGNKSSKTQRNMGNLKLVIKVLLIKVSVFFGFLNNFFQTFFSSIGARGSRAQTYHQKKNQSLSVQFSKIFE